MMIQYRETVHFQTTYLAGYSWPGQGTFYCLVLSFPLSGKFSKLLWKIKKNKNYHLVKPHCPHPEELLPYFGITEKAVGLAPTELVHLDVKKLHEGMNFVMEDGSWVHFEFQSTNEGLEGLKRFRAYKALASYQHKVSVTTYVLFSGRIKKPMTEFHEGINTFRIAPVIMRSRNADELIAQRTGLSLETVLKLKDKQTSAPVL